MTLCKLSFNNIKKSFKDYAIYFITLILGVCIFYVFNSIDSQTAFLNISESQYSIVELIMSAMSGTSIFVSSVLGFLIIYASRFLIKKRNKEFGIYMILGMPKRKISKMLLIETFLIGFISLIIGLLLGILGSQVTSIFVARLFEADMTKFTFMFSKNAFLKTIFYFSIIYLVVMLFNTFIINKCKLIDLLRKNNKNEKIKNKNQILCIVFFIISICILGFAYYMVTDGFATIFYNKTFGFIIVPILLGIVGTVLFFFSFSGIFLKIISSCKNLYFKSLNTFVYKEISGEINAMIISVSTICIMIFLTICLLSSALSIKDYFNTSLTKYAPVDVAISLDNPQIDFDFADFYMQNGIYDKLSGMVQYNLYVVDTFTLKDSLGNYYKTMSSKYPYVDYDAPMVLINVSDYNNVSKIMNFESVSLNNDEYAIICNYETDIFNNVINDGTVINILGRSLTSAYPSVIEGDFWPNGSAGNAGFFVVPDELLNNIVPNNINMLANYKTLNKNEQIKLNSLIYNQKYQGGLSYTSKLDIKDNSVGLSALATFLGLYLGIVFLISSAAIISLKSLSDSIDNKYKYQILRNIGAEESTINKTMFKQTLILFALPLLLAVIHTVFGLRFCLLILSSLGIQNITKSVFFTCLFIFFIYGGYFVVTYCCNKNIVKNRL